MKSPNEPLFSKLFPPFLQEWILFEDEYVIVIDKPAFVSSQAASTDIQDDVVHRLKLFLSQRDNVDVGEVYLGVHQRLDQDTSGVMLFSKSKKANASFSEQFESRKIEKHYVACIFGWQSRNQEKVLKHKLLKSSGKVEIFSPQSQKGKLAITRAVLLAMNQDRSFIELRIETGRTHQIRAQLSHLGHPVVGDILYGGASSHRLFLHSKKIVFSHPKNKQKIVIESEIPEDFKLWFDHKEKNHFDSEKLLRTRIEIAKQRRYGIASLRNHLSYRTDCFRLFHGENDGIEGLFLGVYGDLLVVRLHSTLNQRETEVLFSVLDKLPFQGVYLKQHQKQANILSQQPSSQINLPAKDFILGKAAPENFSVFENGMEFMVDFEQGLTTGLYLDQRDNRKRVFESVKGKKVLNLFAHQCAFSVAALFGHAKKVVSVDASKKSLLLGQSNLDYIQQKAQNKTELSFIHEDVFQYLKRTIKRQEKFDLVIVDPPTYSTVKKTRWTSGQMWTQLASLAMEVTEPEGRLILCSNDRRMPFRQFKNFVRQASSDVGRDIQKLKQYLPPSDFPSFSKSKPAFKTLIVDLE